MKPFSLKNIFLITLFILNSDINFFNDLIKTNFSKESDRVTENNF